MIALGACGQSPAAQEETPPLARAQSTPQARVLVVINEASTDSKALGSYYVEARDIPRENVVRVNVSTSPNISMDEYLFGIEDKVRKAIERTRGAGGRIDYVVMTRGTPYRLRDNNGYSVDAFLAAMNLDVEPITKLEPEEIQKTISPYFGKAERFNSEKFNMYLVTRLDGYTLEDAKALVDRSLAAMPHRGPFFFDAAGNRKDSSYGALQRSMIRADEWLRTNAFESTLEDTETFVTPPGPVAGYVSWGSNDGRFNGEAYKAIRFKPGAIAETYVSTSARQFTPAASGQSLIGDLIAGGVTGVKGYVSEPYTFALCPADVLISRYCSGFNLAESFYGASPVVKWKDVVIGDPLCNPYRGSAALDPATPN